MMVKENLAVGMKRGYMDAMMTGIQCGLHWAGVWERLDEKRARDAMERAQARLEDCDLSDHKQARKILAHLRRELDELLPEGK